MEGTLETGIVALLFSATFLVGERVHPFRGFIRDRRSVVSFGAGMAVAYVFVYLMPELHSVRSSFAEAVSTPLPYKGMVVYFLALVGFLVFYGIDNLRTRLGETAGQGLGLEFKLHIGGFAAYVCLIGYLLVDNLEETLLSTVLYATAIVFHFVAVDHALREEHGGTYQRTGRFILAGACMFGWGLGLVIALPRHMLSLLTAFISGAIIINSAIMELPGERDGRFLPFMTGGIVYGLILVPLG
jgi:hypothetical protein